MPEQDDTIQSQINEWRDLDSGEAILKTQSALNELLSLDDTDGYRFRPSRYAYQTAWWLILEAYSYLGDDFPEPSISPDGEGGISLDWMNDKRLVRLDLPESPSRRAYIYYEDGEKHGVVYTLSGKALTDWLKWLMNA
ncbi:MAG: hypothetical protein L0229_27570 [Blastocatellia bacterium]|nr:hypothetical protein [Blastocatellia bacterium]